MEITDGQDYAITLSMGNYNREKSSIIFEAGSTNKDKNGIAYFNGDFIAHIYRKGKFRFSCYEAWSDEIRHYHVERRKL